MPTNELTVSFDIGYASIGWCVLDTTHAAPVEPTILGTGVVTFPTDDCLASKRRGLRRTRRHIRSTRQRIERMKRWLVHRNVLTRTELDLPGHPAPFLLAAAVLQGHKTLTAFELWTVLRWYAHNRGYDGNSLWSRDEANDDDTEKETNAKKIMADKKTDTMAETVCACLDLNPADHAKRISSALPYKTLNAAYPREIVYREVGKILCKHTGVLPNLDTETVRFLLKNSALTKEEREKLTAADIKLPRRYHGGLLFGQLVPRFDNRIISRCPITWAETHDTVREILPLSNPKVFAERFGEWVSIEKKSGTRTDHWEKLIAERNSEIAAGSSEQKVDDRIARQLAEKFAKVPAAKSVEFLEYRFARILANLRVDGQPIAKELRHILLGLARKQGRLTLTDLKRELGSYYGKAKTNIGDYFTLHPDSKKALVLKHAENFLHSNQMLKPLLPFLSEGVKNKALGHWERNRGVRLGDLLVWSGEAGDSSEELEKALIELHKKDRQKDRKGYDFTQFLSVVLIPEDLSGRAAYARPVLRRVLAEVLEGFDPTRSAKDDADSQGNRKAADGVLYPLGVKGSRVRILQDERPLDQLTNNHLVRHRLLILERLSDDIAKEFLSDDRQVSQVVVEVARELKEFSGKDAQAIKAALREKLKDFKTTIGYLEKHAPDMELNGSLIRKARIAMDMERQCPFTGESYDIYDIKTLEREHIIPFASRNTNALHALVLTWPEINRWKGKRSARQFIIDEGGKNVPGRENLSLFTLKQYEDFVQKLDTKGHPDDARRKKARKALLLTTDMDDKDLGFTDGQLTQTSHLAKLAMRGLTQRFPAAIIDPIPGPVTAELRKAWDLTGTLSLVCPEVLDAEGKVKPKGEIRSLTHMHHALDAATIAIAAHYFPLRKHGEDQKGKLWRALLKRGRTPEEQALLHKTGIFKAYQKPRYDHEGSPLGNRTELKLEDLPATLKQSLRLSLAKARVMQHIPADRSGAKAELTTWGVVSTEGEGEDARITLRQNATTIENGLRKYDRKTREERAGKLLGANPKESVGKLAAIKGAMIISENYGLALDPTPTVIPFHNVQERLAELRKANGEKPIRVLRNGMLIKLEKSPARSRQDYSGIWRIASIKNNKGAFLIDMIRPAYITPQNGVVWSGMNKTLGPLMECGLTILPRNYGARQD